MNEHHEQGRVEYTHRAFQQDAAEAMGGNIVRGLIELITNCDDAYTKMGAARGSIRVEVEHKARKPWKLVVRDRATGMSRAEMHEGLARLGTRTSGFAAGMPVRGNRGRGAKDLAAFGAVTWESVKEGKLSTLVLQPNGEWDLRERLATADDRERLGIRRNGTVVTVSVEHSSCPRHDSLRTQLGRHFELRFITTDSARELVLANTNAPHEQDRIRFDVDSTCMETVFDGDVKLPGYENTTAALKIWRLPERVDARPNDPTRASGVLIRGRRTVYANTLFGLDANPHAGWFAGELDCAEIDAIANDYDERLEAGLPPEPNNPIPLITRRREGLADRHPFTQALEKACIPILQRLIGEEDERARQRARSAVSRETKTVLGRLAREAARFLHDELRELDAEDPGRVGEGDERAVVIVPPEAVLIVGTEKTLSIIARENHAPPGDDVHVAVDPAGILDVVTGPSVPLTPHKQRLGYVTGQARLRALVVGEALVSARLGETEVVAHITVKPGDAVTEGAPDAPLGAPESLEFERRRYALHWTKRKSVLVRAPDALIAEFGDTLSVRSDHAGIVVLGGPFAMRRSASGDWWESKVSVEGRSLGSKATLTAQIGDTRAHARAAVEHDESDQPPLRVELDHVSQAGVYRALFEPPVPHPVKGQTLSVKTQHPGLRDLVGREFENVDTPQFRAVLAEVVTDAVVRRLMERRYPSGGEPVDTLGFYVDMYTYTSRLLPVMHKLAGELVLDGVTS